MKLSRPLRSYAPTLHALHALRSSGSLPLAGRARRLCALAGVGLLAAGCQVLTYTGPNGEHFSRTSLGATTTLASLSVEADTNGLRRVELRGYTNDTAQALGTVTEAAVRAALSAK